jgi:hypothetical protein
MAGLLALMTILLIGFAPVAWIFSQSTESIVAMGALHLIFWLISTYFGLKFLHQSFGGVDGKTGGGLKVWDDHFPSRHCANDNCIASDNRNGTDIFAGGKEILSEPLGGLPQREFQSQTGHS